MDAVLACKATATVWGSMADLPVSAHALGKGHEPWGFVATGLKVMLSDRFSNCSPISCIQKWQQIGGEHRLQALEEDGEWGSDLLHWDVALVQVYGLWLCS